MLEMAMATEHSTSPGRLELLPTRPPTPPRETPETGHPMPDVPAELKNAQSPLQAIPTDTNALPTIPSTSPKAGKEVVIPDTQLSTPPKANSPRTPSTALARKGKANKVTFSDITHSQPAVNYDDEHARPSPSLPPSRTLRATRGILKASPLPIRIDSGFQSKIVIMLDSILKQLAGPDKTSRIEAYSTLTAAIKKSTNLPDRTTLNENMVLLLKFIQRDIVTPPSKEPINHSLVIQSLSLLNAMLIFPSLNVNGYTDFGIFIVDHTIKAFEEPKLAKEIVRNLLQTMHTQNFPLRTWTNERVKRLVHSLRDMESRIQSSKVCMFRSRIFKRLLKQCRSHLMVNVEWLPCLFTDMISSVPEVRGAAIDFGYDAALSMGMEKDMTAKVLTLLAAVDASTNKTYLEFYAGKLSEQFKKPTPEELAAESAVEKGGKPAASCPADARFKDLEAVSKIWTIVMLFLRSRPLDRWEALREWLNIIPPCFNSSDLACRLEANIAWARFIYIAHLHESYFTRMISQAIVRTYISQLSRRQLSRKSEAPFRKAVLGGVCTVYYYAFGPNTSSKMQDRYWDATVPLFKTMTQENAHPDLRSGALDIMVSLLDTSGRRPWNEELVLGPITFAKPNDIPCLDVRWIRRNLSKVQTAILPTIDRDVMSLGAHDSHVYKLCRAVSNAICSLAAKEIKISVETVEYTRLVVKTVKGLWAAGVAGVEPDANAVHDQKKAEQWLHCIKSYTMLAIDGLGMLPFMEPINIDGTVASSSFGSPSRRGQLAGTGVTNCLEMLIQTFSTLPRGTKDNFDYADFLDNVFSPFITPQTGLVVSTMLQARLSDMTGSSIPCGFYNLVVRAITHTLDPKASVSSRLVQPNAETPIGHEYKSLVKVLEIGLRNCQALTWTELQELYTPLSRHIYNMTSSVGVALVLIEPLARLVLAAINAEGPIHLNYVLSAIAIVRSAAQAPDRMTVDNANRRLWGVPGTKTASYDTFNVLYDLLNALFVKVYVNRELGTDGFLTMLFREARSFFDRCSEPLVLRTLGFVQQGLSVWVADEDGRLEGTLYQLYKALVTEVCSILIRQDPKQLSLHVLEPLLIAGFESTHSEFVNLFATAWNRIFENIIDLQYPDKLKETLTTVRSQIDLVLPGMEDSADSTLVSFRQTQTFEVAIPETQDLEMLDDLPPSRPTSRPSSRSSRRSAPSPVPNTGFAIIMTRSRTNSLSNIPAKTTPAPAPAAPRPRPRPRHDDSQVDFVVIDPLEVDDPEIQALTEHQQEVRERQRQESKILPVDLQPANESQQLDELPLPMAEAQRDGTPAKNDEEAEDPETPTMEQSYEEYLSQTQTPTPVRTAQASLLNQDMSDVPSSPIERQSSVSRFPLIPEMARNNVTREEWPEFSSPVNSSPIKPLRLTRSRRRAAEKETEQDSQETEASESQESISQQVDEQGDDETTPMQCRRLTRSRRSSRRTVLELPPLQMTTRSASRGSQDVSFSDVLSPVSSPLKRMSRAAASKTMDKSDEEVSTFQESMSVAPRTRSQRRPGVVPETPSQCGSGRSTKARTATVVEATPTPTTRRSKRQLISAPQWQESAVAEKDHVMIIESSPAVEQEEDQDGDSDRSSFVVTRSGSKRKRGEMRDTPMPRKRTRTRSRRRRGLLREKSQEMEVEEGEEEEEGEKAQVCLEDVEVKEEVKEPSSDLSDLSEGETMLSVRSVEGEVTTIAETQEFEVATDEEADTQIFAELEASTIPSGCGQRIGSGIELPLPLPSPSPVVIADSGEDVEMTEAMPVKEEEDKEQEEKKEGEKSYSLEDILKNIQEATRMLKEGELKISGAEASLTDAATLELKRALLEAEDRWRVNERR